MAKPNISEIKDIIKKALSEDIGPGDVTSRALIPAEKKMKAKIVSKEAGVVAGVGIAKMVFEALDRKLKVKTRVKDGARIVSGRTVLEISGPARSILTAERTALNFLQRMSGIASLTRQFVDRAKPAKILATRKTAPGLRALDKYSVEAGGGLPHRMGLYDAFLVKENHIDACGGVLRAVSLARKASLKKSIEVEARTLSEAYKAARAGADIILLDNMSASQLKSAVRLIRAIGRKIRIEASGGMNLGNISKIAKTGVDYISVGALTHSPKALDMGLDVIT